MTEQLSVSKQIIAKTCPRCFITKEINYFGKDCNTSDGLTCHCKTCRLELNNKRRKIKRQKDPNWKFIQDRKRVNNRLKKDFGINLQDYIVMFKQQNGLCAICGKTEVPDKNGTVKRLAVDHCHKTNKVRALLCNNCNGGLGNFKDEVSMMKKAIEYLEKYERSGVDDR